MEAISTYIQNLFLLGFKIDIEFIVIKLFFQLLKLLFLVLTIIIVWFLVFYCIRLFDKKKSAKFQESTFSLLNEIFIDNVMIDSIGSLIYSVYRAISSIISTLATLISVVFTSFTFIIEWPFNLLHSFFDTLNEKMAQKNQKYQEYVDELRFKRKSRSLELKRKRKLRKQFLENNQRNSLSSFEQNYFENIQPKMDKNQNELTLTLKTK